VRLGRVAGVFSAAAAKTERLQGGQQDESFAPSKEMTLAQPDGSLFERFWRFVEIYSLLKYLFT
jgi:hypothetical protein